MAKKRLIRLSCSFLLISFFLFCAVRFYYYLTDDFRLSNIRDQRLTSYKQISFPQENLLLARQILKQPFTYLGKGAQSYVFVSQDGNYVLKFFKFKHLRPSWWLKVLPPFSIFQSIKERSQSKKERKLHDLFSGYELAFSRNCKNSALLFLHLSSTSFLHQSIALTDKIGKKHLVHADQEIFLLQKKGTTLRDRLSQTLDLGQLHLTKQAIASVLAMYVAEYQMGIYDRDHGVLDNIGFIEESPFHLDTGKLTEDESLKEKTIYQQDLQIVIWQIEQWIQKNYPIYFDQIDPFLALQYQQLTGEVWQSSLVNAEVIKNWRHRR